MVSPRTRDRSSFRESISALLFCIGFNNNNNNTRYVLVSQLLLLVVVLLFDEISADMLLYLLSRELTEFVGASASNLSVAKPKPNYAADGGYCIVLYCNDLLMSRVESRQIYKKKKKKSRKQIVDRHPKSLPWVAEILGKSPFTSKGLVLLVYCQ